MSKAFIAGVAVGFLIAWAMRQERVTSALSFPAGPEPINDPGLYYLYNYGLI